MDHVDSLLVFPLDGLPEISPGDDLGALISEAARADLADGDILAVTSKIVSKAEGRIASAADREAAITAETVRVVATRPSSRPDGFPTRIVENRLGLIMAAAGVDASNTPDGTVLLLPLDPDASAARVRATVQRMLGVTVGVIVTDTSGRAWRNGQTDITIGSAGVRVLEPLLGHTDAHGRMLVATLPAIADELAAAAELVKGKSSQRPVAVIRGAARHLEDADGDSRALIRSHDDDLFHTGARESWDAGYAAGLAAGLAAGAAADDFLPR